MVSITFAKPPDSAGRCGHSVPFRQRLLHHTLSGIMVVKAGVTSKGKGKGKGDDVKAASAWGAPKPLQSIQESVAVSPDAAKAKESTRSGPATAADAATTTT